MLMKNQGSYRSRYIGINSEDEGASLVAQTVKNLAAIWETGFDSWVGKMPWRSKWKPTPITLPGEFHGHTVRGVTKSQT